MPADATIRARVGGLPGPDLIPTATVLTKPLSECRVAICTTAGLRAAGDVKLWQDTSFTVLPTDARDLQLDVNGIVCPIEKVIEIADGASIAEVGWDATTAIAASQDIRAYYEEAGLQLADNTGARQLETWFFHQTETGQLIRRARDGMRERKDDKLAVTYLAPGTRN